jgi:Ca2+-binding EF-hand superfamily protein
VLEWLGNSDSETVAAARLKDLFFAFDSDGGGCLDVSELMAGLQSFDIYLTRAQIVGLMPGVDANNDSVVSSRC